MSNGYTYTIQCSSEFSFLTVNIPADQMLKVEASSMASMDSHVSLKTRLKGGFKRFLARESVFINEYTACGADGEISIAPGPSGDVIHQSIAPEAAFYLSSSSYVASTPGVTIDTKFQGLVKGFFSGESLFLIKCSGSGDLWFNTYGAIFSVDVRGEYIVDTGHIVAFTEGLSYDISRVGGYKSLFFSGEGLVCRFKGEGKVWIQTRNPGALINWAHGFRPVKSSRVN